MSVKICQTMGFVAICVSVMTVGLAMATAEGGQSSGATVKGQITFNGTIPPTRKISVRRDAKFCGQIVERSVVIVEPDSKGVANVVVSIEGVTAGTKSHPAKQPVPLVNENCQFFPHTQVTMVKNQLEISSVDPVLHNTHIRTKKHTFLNIALPPTGRIIRKPLKRAGRLEVRCDAHKFMQSTIHVFQHPYYSLTGQDGAFEISNVPIGKYQLHVWHETFGLQKHTITVPSSGEVVMNLNLPSTP